MGMGMGMGMGYSRPAGVSRQRGWNGRVCPATLAHIFTPGPGMSGRGGSFFACYCLFLDVYPFLSWNMVSAGPVHKPPSDILLHSAAAAVVLSSILLTV